MLLPISCHACAVNVDSNLRNRGCLWQFNDGTGARHACCWPTGVPGVLPSVRAADCARPARTRRRRVPAWMVTVVALVAGVSVSAALAQSVPDTTIKAAFIARFPEFVAWPRPDAPPSGPLSVCLSPAHPFGTKVAEAAGPAVGSRPLRVRVLNRRDVVDGCDVLYIAPLDISLLQRAQRQPILTVGDQPDFCRLGGVINLRVIDRRVRFEVDLDQAREVGLTLDSQLLRLAAVVYGGRP